MRTLESEVLVVGGGPAGTLVASSLARAGRATMQVVGPPPTAVRPFEVLVPATRRLLAQHGLAEPQGPAAPCRGVLSCWGTPEPDFRDYALLSCLPGLAIDRRAFHEALVGSSETAGVQVVRATRLGRSQAPGCSATTWEALVEGQPVQLRASRLVEATGRQGSPCTPSHIRREYFNRLVALTTPFVARKWTDCLLVEASSGGWWYMPPSIGDRTQLVFLTDADLLPRGIAARQLWLRRQFDGTRLLADIAANAPAFQQVQGTDARSSRVSAPTWEHWVATGDAALALDPLSGKGTLLALRGAAQVAEALVQQRPVGGEYTDWWSRTCAQEQVMASEVYAQAAGQFPDSPFWRRRNLLTEAP